ncbi:hypothetical protein EVAR_6316_1 [Eumeta japonica]|uniref:Uncharacterized protein n=1 Tax=Eumeta variegata TaxID=151549 RepID=A0A4C1T8D9_EUMVA|nr:hypothetical protein EVAR_6316_1 [Eumeta japonica]
MRALDASPANNADTNDGHLGRAEAAVMASGGGPDERIKMASHRDERNIRILFILSSLSGGLFKGSDAREVSELLDIQTAYKRMDQHIFDLLPSGGLRLHLSQIVLYAREGKINRSRSGGDTKQKQSLCQFYSKRDKCWSTTEELAASVPDSLEPPAIRAGRIPPTGAPNWRIKAFLMARSRRGSTGGAGRADTPRYTKIASLHRRLQLTEGPVTTLRISL